MNEHRIYTRVKKIKPLEHQPNRPAYRYYFKNCYVYYTKTDGIRVRLRSNTEWYTDVSNWWEDSGPNPNWKPGDIDYVTGCMHHPCTEEVTDWKGNKVEIQLNRLHALKDYMYEKVNKREKEELKDLRKKIEEINKFQTKYYRLGQERLKAAEEVGELRVKYRHTHPKVEEAEAKLRKLIDDAEDLVRNSIQKKHF